MRVSSYLLYLPYLLTYLTLPTYPACINLFIYFFLSATDPVAVVAILKELGIDESLSILIEVRGRERGGATRFKE